MGKAPSVGRKDDKRFSFLLSLPRPEQNDDNEEEREKKRWPSTMKASGRPKNLTPVVFQAVARRPVVGEEVIQNAIRVRARTWKFNRRT